MFEALSQEVFPVLEFCRFNERAMPRWLRPARARYLRPGFLRTRQELVWEPYGTVAILAPSNFPFSLGLMSAVYLLLAGNTVVLKPSERHPDMVDLLGQLFEEAEIAPSVASVVEGGPDVGRYLAGSEGVAKVIFFGRTDAGRQLARICAERGTPFVLEMGGGSTAIVLADADLDLAAAGIAWSGFYSGGRSCVGTDRVYVESEVATDFESRLAREVRAIWREGPCTSIMDDRVVAVVEDALKRGAEYSVRSDISAGKSAGTAAGVLVDVDPDSLILREELFAPIIAVCRVEHAEKGALLANSGCQMLGASIWTRNRRRGQALARRLNVNMVWINDTSVGLPTLPWGGRAGAGWGSLFGRHALHEAARLKWISRNASSGRRPWWPPYSQAKRRALRILTHFYRR